MMGTSVRSHLMKRRLFNLTAVVSLVFCAGMVALWVRSAFRHDSFDRTKDSTILAVESLRGQIAFRRIWMGGLADRTSWRSSPVTKRDHAVGVLGFSWVDSGTDGTGRGLPASNWIVIAAPHWLFVVMGLVLPAAVIRRRMKFGKSAGSRVCGRCGYDVRATPDRCPECGRWGC